MLKLLNLEYEHKTKGVKKANIVCTSQEDAIKYLVRVTKNQVTKINNIGMDFDIHGYSDDSITYITKKLGFSKDQKNTTESSDSSTLEGEYKCPWCEKSYGSAQALKVHMSKAHNVKAVKEESKEE